MADYFWWPDVGTISMDCIKLCYYSAAFKSQCYIIMLSCPLQHLSGVIHAGYPIRRLYVHIAPLNSAGGYLGRDAQGFLGLEQVHGYCSWNIEFLAFLILCLAQCSSHVWMSMCSRTIHVGQPVCPGLPNLLKASLTWLSSEGCLCSLQPRVLRG